MINYKNKRTKCTEVESPFSKGNHYILSSFLSKAYNLILYPSLDKASIALLISFSLTKI